MLFLISKFKTLYNIIYKYTFGIFIKLNGFQANFNFDTDEYDFAFALLHDVYILFNSVKYSYGWRDIISRGYYEFVLYIVVWKIIIEFIYNIILII